MPAKTISPSSLFGILSEFIVLLLGGLLVAIAISGRFGITRQPAPLLILGAILTYWGARAGMKRETKGNRALPFVRAISLVIVGLLVIAIPLTGYRYGLLLLGVAGAVLVVRGITASLMLLRAK